jgi:hypothetical protein
MAFVGRQWLMALACMATAACGLTEPKNSVDEQKAARQRVAAQRLKATCASDATNDRLKQVAFDEAIRIRNADPQNLDLLSTHALMRVENPIVKSRDDTLDVTVCSGRLILHVPPGAEKAFAGKTQLAADIEYAAQAAADGSGLVYQIKGAEPIIYSLAAFDLKAEAYRPAAPARQIPPAAVAVATERAVELPQSAPPVAVAPARPTPTAAAPTAPAPKAAAPTTPQRASTSPSFNCRSARARSERMVCNSALLASLDRTMSSQFYSELDRGDERTRAALRRTRDQFLARRNRCSDGQCVAQVYRGRMEEIRDIAGRQ